MYRRPRRPPGLAILAATLVVLITLGAACSGGSSSSGARSTTSGTQPAGAAGGQSQVTTTIQAGTATAAVGAEAQAVLQALAVGPPGLGAWTFNVAYDPAVVSIAKCDGTETSACNTSYDGHTIRLAGATGNGLQGDVTLATLTFQCKAAGTSSLKVTVDLLADATIANPLPIEATTQDGSITCT